MLCCMFTTPSQVKYITPYTFFYFPMPSFSYCDNIYCLKLLMYIIIVNKIVQNVMETKGTSDMISH